MLHTYAKLLWQKVRVITKLTLWYTGYPNSQAYFPNTGKKFHSFLYLDCGYRPPLCMVFWRQEHIPCLHILLHTISLSVSLLVVIFLLYLSPMSCHFSSDIMAMVSSALGFLFRWCLREDCFPHSCSPPVTLPTMFYFHLLIFFFFCWRIIALQCCISFLHTTTWISHKYTYAPSLFNFLPTSHPPLPL